MLLMHASAFAVVVAPLTCHNGHECEYKGLIPSLPTDLFFSAPILFFSAMMTCFLIITNWPYWSTSVGVLVRRRETVLPTLALSLLMLVSLVSNCSVSPVWRVWETVVKVKYRWKELSAWCDWYQSLLPELSDEVHRLGPVERASDEAKRLLQLNIDTLKMWQEEVEEEMKNCDVLMEELKAEHNDTAAEMRRHKEEQVSRDNLVIHLFFTFFCLRHWLKIVSLQAITHHCCSCQP